MGDPIKIVVTAETAQAAAALRDFVNQSGTGLNEVAKAATKTSSAMMEFSHGTRAGYEGTRALSSAVFLLGGTHFPQLTMGIFGSMEALRAMRSTALLTGASLATIIPITGAIAAAVGAGALIWHEFSSAEAEAAKATKDLEEALGKLPELLEQINTLRKAGVLGPGAAAEFADYATGRKKLYKDSQGNLTQNPTEQVEGVKYVPMDKGMEAQQVFTTQNLPEASMSEIYDWLQKQLSGEGGLHDTREKAVNELKDFVAKAQADTITGLQKEEAAIHKRYQKERDEITDTMKTAGPRLMPTERAAAEAALAKSQSDEQLAIAAAQGKAQAELATKWNEEKNKTVEQQDRELNAAIEAYTDQSTIKTKKFYDDVYAARLGSAKQELDAEMISEDQFEAKAAAATKERDAAYKAVNETLQKTIELRQEISRAETEGRLTAIQGNPLLSQDQKAQQSIPLWQQTMEKNQASIDELNATAATTKEDAARLEAQKQIVDLMRQQAELQNKINAAKGDNSFTYQLQLAAARLQEVNNFAKDAAGIFTGALNTGVTSLANNMTKVIEGTESWRRGLQNVARTMLTDIINAIVQVIVKLTEEAVIAGILDILTAGTGGGVATGLPAGYAEGGRPTPGQPVLVGEEGREIFVPDSAGTIVPANKTAAMLSTGMGGGSATVGRHQVNIHFYDKRPHPKDWAFSSEGENWLIETSRKNRLKIGIGT